MNSAQMQLTLSEDELKTPKPAKGTHWIGNWQIRDFKGFKQSREGGVGNWMFYISSFDGTTDGECGYCNVMLSSGELERVQIDAQSRIVIDGKKYGRAYWSH